MFHRIAHQEPHNTTATPVAFNERGYVASSGREVLPPVDRTVEILSAVGQAGRDEFLALRHAVTSSEALRSEALRAICEHPSLIERPGRRAALLEALLPFSREPLVRELAVVSLESSYLKNSERAVAASSKILSVALAATGDNAATLSLELERRLLKVASRYVPGGGNLAAGTALYLIPATSIPAKEPFRIQSLARAWFVERNQEKNPWLLMLSTLPSAENVRFIGQVATGRVPKSEGAGLLATLSAMPLTVHHVAATAAIATVTTRQICAYFKLPKALSNATIAVLSAVLVVGAEAISRAYQADSLNADRDWERVEALARLAAMRASISDSPAIRDQRVANRISALLAGASRSVLQSPFVREAARIAMASEPFDPVDLWNKTLAAGNFSAVERRYLPDIQA